MEEVWGRGKNVWVYGSMVYGSGKRRRWSMGQGEERVGVWE